MAWTSPTTRATGDLITASIWNTDIVNNLLMTAPAIMTAAGDTLYASAANTPARLGKGTVGQHYRMNPAASNEPSWFTPPSCRVYTTGVTSSTGSAFTAVIFPNERWDIGSLHAAGTSATSSRITVPANFSGIWEVGGIIQWQAGAGGQRWAAIRVDGGTYVAVQSVDNPSAGIGPIINVSCLYTMTSGSYFELVGFQSTTGTLTMDPSANYAMEFWAHYLGTSA